MQGGSAVQLFKGLDARQLKVSNDNTRNAAFDFRSVLSEKSFEKTDTNRALTDTKAEQKLNKHEMTSKRTPEVRDAKDDSSAVKQTRNKESESVQEELKVTDKQNEDDSKELSAVKKLLKKLGMSDEEVDALLEMLPEDMVTDFIQVIQEMPQMTEMSLSGEEQSELVTTIQSLSDVFDQITTQLSDMISESPDLKQAIEAITQKLEDAQLNLEDMKVSDFAKLVESVVNEAQAVDESGDEAKADVEIVEVKVIDPVSEKTDVKPETAIEVQADEKTDAEPKDSGEDNKKDTSAEQSTAQATAPVQATSEQSPSQVDQSFAEMIKIENSLIKNAQPMELASGRVRLAQNIMSQVMDGTKLNVNPMENGQQIILKLRPEELGNVDLKLSVEKGILMAEFNVESQIVKETLESNMADLKQALASKGYNIEGMQVSVGQEQTEQQSQFENKFFNQSTQRKYFFGDDEEVANFESINKTLAGLQSTFEYLG